MQLFRFSVLLGLLLLSQGNSAFAAITVSFAEVYSKVGQDYDAPNVPDLLNTSTSSLLAGGTATAVLPSFSSITIGANSTAGNGASFTESFSQTRPGGRYAYSHGQSVVQFTTDVNVPYKITGSFTNPVGYTTLHGRLFDITVSNLVFEKHDWGPNGPFTFKLDGSGDSGTYGSLATGMVDGMLLANHTYQWYVSTNTQAYLAADNGATATGSASLLIGNAIQANVPEPASLIVWLVSGIVGAVTLRRRRTVA